MPYQRVRNEEYTPSACQHLAYRMFDLIRDHGDWSQKTFGKDSELIEGFRGTIGAADHLEKEAREIQANPGDIAEHADALLLLLDIVRRAGYSIFDLLKAAEDKMVVNKARKWNKPVPGKATEHVK